MIPLNFDAPIGAFKIQCNHFILHAPIGASEIQWNHSILNAPIGASEMQLNLLILNAPIGASEIDPPNNVKQASGKHNAGSRKGLAAASAQRPWRVDWRDFACGCGPSAGMDPFKLRGVWCDPARRVLIPEY